MAVEVYKLEEAGIIIDPPSDVKEVFIPSPPTMTTVKINPRSAIIYITGGKISETYEKLDMLKQYAEENKTMIICPEDADTENLAKVYEYVMEKAKMLNVKGGEIAVAGDLEHMQMAQELVDYLVDELDADIEEAQKFEI